MAKLKQNESESVAKKPFDAQKVISALKGMISSQKKMIETLKERVKVAEDGIVEFSENWDYEIQRLSQRVASLEAKAEKKKKWWKFF